MVRVRFLGGLPKKRLDNEVKICDNSICEVERERILMIGAPPSVGGEGVARLPRERDFNKKNKSKLKTAFLQSYRKEHYGKN